MDAVFNPTWKLKCISVSSDGARNTVGSTSSLVSHISSHCDPCIIEIWCGLHQLELNKLVIAHSNLTVCQQHCILAQLTGIVYIMLYGMLHYVGYKSVFLTVYSLSSLQILSLFLSWILSYQDHNRITLPGLIISILFYCRITHST